MGMSVPERRVVVVGGGAAGMMASIFAGKAGARVTLLERGEKLGKKVYITGKGRCNVTNDCTLDEFLHEVARNPRFLYSALSFFSPQDMMQLLEDAGCPVVVQRGRRVFPATEKASDVTRTLARLMQQYHLTQEQAARRVGKSQSAIANKLRLLQLTADQRQFVLDNGLTERHARAVLRLPENRRSEALIMIAKRKMNARATDLYIDQLLNETPGKHRVSMVKDVRIFVNTIDHAIRLMTDNGVPATSHREERDGYIEYTVRIPTAAAQK